MLKIATDVTADLPTELANQHQIHIFHNWVYLKTGRCKTDEVEIADLFNLLIDEVGKSRTAPLSEDEYYQSFCDLTSNGDSLILVAPSRGASPLYDTAQKAAADLPQVYVHDSRGLSLVQGFQAIRAAQMAAAGKSVEEIIRVLDQMAQSAQFLCVLENLSYLRHGGRVNMAQYLLGSMLVLKPVITLTDGRVIPVSRVRTFDRALDEMQQRMQAQIEKLPDLWLGVMHSQAPEAAQTFAKKLKAAFNPAYMLVTEARANVAIHGGPGAVGLVACSAYEA